MISTIVCPVEQSGVSWFGGGDRSSKIQNQLHDAPRRPRRSNLTILSDAADEIKSLSRPHLTLVRAESGRQRTRLGCLA
jgi:hypothetical protein